MHFFWVTFKNTFVYRFSVIFSILGSILFIAINLLLWRFLYSDDPDMMAYMTRYTIISNIIAMFYAVNIAYRIGNKVATGAFVIDLIKPVNIFIMSWEMELADIASGFLLRGLPVVIVYLPFLIGGSGYVNIPYVILAVLMGHLLFLLIYSLLGFAAYILIEIWPFNRLLDDTIRLLAGGFIPLAILPDFLKVIADILPFRFLYSFPLELLFGRISETQIFDAFMQLVLWICVFGIFNLIMYRAALKKAVIQGG